MTYIEIRKLIEENKLELSIELEIASCVCASTAYIKERVNDEDFSTLCNVVRIVWDKIDHPCTQTIADIVVDDIYNCFEYWNRKPLTYSELYDNINTITEQYWARIN